MTNPSIRILVFTACLILGTASDALCQNSNRAIEKPVEQSIAIRKETQKKDEAWRAEKEKLTARLEALEQARSQLLAQRDQFLQYVEAARARVAEKQKQLADIREISLEIQPFLKSLMDELESSLSDGLPFLSDERAGRLKRLKSVMGDPEVSISEKYRKVMEALQVEAEYGTTIETYPQTLDLPGGPTLVNVFRLGRLNLFYLTLDLSQCGFFNVAHRQWEPLPPTCLKDIQAAVDIASRRRTAQLLTLPLGRINAP